MARGEEDSFGSDTEGYDVALGMDSTDGYVISVNNVLRCWAMYANGEAIGSSTYNMV